MAKVNDHLSIEQLEERYVACGNATASRHFQAIWLARGHTVSEVSEMTAFGRRWIEQLLARYNAEGPDTLMIEALACGRPVIAFNRGSVPEVIEDGLTGFVVEVTHRRKEALRGAVQGASHG